MTVEPSYGREGGRFRMTDEPSYGHERVNIQPVAVIRGLKRQQAAALTNYVECFLLALSFLFSLLLSALNDLTGLSTRPLARITYSVHHLAVLDVTLICATQYQRES